MSGIGIEISSETMERVQALLANIPKGAERAYSNAINRGFPCESLRPGGM